MCLVSSNVEKRSHRPVLFVGPFTLFIIVVLLSAVELLLLIELEPVFLSFYYSPYLILQRNNDSLEKWMHQMNTITLLPSYIKFFLPQNRLSTSFPSHITFHSYSYIWIKIAKEIFYFFYLLISKDSNDRSFDVIMFIYFDKTYHCFTIEIHVNHFILHFSHYCLLNLIIWLQINMFVIVIISIFNDPNLHGNYR